MIVTVETIRQKCARAKKEGKGGDDEGGAVTFQSVTSVDLARSSFTGTGDVSMCTMLRRLNLSGNSIASSKSIASLRHLPSLTWLDVSQNDLCEIDGICQIQSLTVLNVSKNKIATVSTRILTMVSLQAFIATDNRIAVLPALPATLDALVVSRNEISDFGSVLRPLTQLKKLSASHNRLYGMPDLQKCASLKEVRLGDNKILAFGGNTLPPLVQILDVARNQLPTLKTIESIFGLAHLRFLNLAGNPACTTAGFYDRIKEALPRLVILDSKTICTDKATKNRERLNRKRARMEAAEPGAPPARP